MKDIFTFFIISFTKFPSNLPFPLYIRWSILLIFLLLTFASGGQVRPRVREFCTHISRSSSFICFKHLGHVLQRLLSIDSWAHPLTQAGFQERGQK